MQDVAYILCLLVTIYFIILLARIILSWVPSLPEPIQPLARGVRALTDPLLNPLRGLIPPISAGGVGLDLSPLLLFFVIIILRGILCS